MSTSDLTTSPSMTPKAGGSLQENEEEGEHGRSGSVDKIPLLSEQAGSTGVDRGAKDVAKERKVGELPP